MDWRGKLTMRSDGVVALHKRYNYIKDSDIWNTYFTRGLDWQGSRCSKRIRELRGGEKA